MVSVVPAWPSALVGTLTLSSLSPLVTQLPLPPKGPIRKDKISNFRALNGA